MILQPFDLPFAEHFPNQKINIGSPRPWHGVYIYRISLRYDSRLPLRLGWPMGTSLDAVTYTRQLSGKEWIRVSEIVVKIVWEPVTHNRFR